MAERRMFAKTIIDSDAFLDMPLSAQALYFHLSMRADDDGFVNNPKKIQRMVGASDDDGKLLAMKRFILNFESGVIVIKHWKIHNYIRNDRYKETVYQAEKSMLVEKENKAYTFGIPDGIPNGYQMETQVSIGKDRSELGLYSGSSSIGNPTTTAATQNVENSVENLPEENEELLKIGGKLGKGVVFLTESQIGDLLEKMTLDEYEEYVERLANWIIKKDAKIGNHYKTILKWWREDKQIEGGSR